MISLLNFSTVMPDDEDREKFGDYADGIQFLKSETGVKWYDVQKEFSAETFKILYPSNGRISAIDNEVSKLFPIEMSILEVESLPDGCTVQNITNGDWRVESGQIVYSPVTVEVINE